MSEKQSLAISPVVASTIVKCVIEAVGDKIKEDIRIHNLKTQNSTPTRIWDLLNTDLCAGFNSTDCMAYNSKRGPWEMVIIYEKNTGFVYTLMREKRYKEIRDGLRKRKRMHYVDALVRHLNPDLLAPVGQTSLDSISFQDEDDLPNIIQKLLSDLLQDGAVIKRHVLVLFESARFELSSIRAIMVDSNLDIVAEDNWASYITADESTIVEQVENPNYPSNNPSRGLKLTAKATARKKESTLKEDKKEQAELF